MRSNCVISDKQIEKEPYISEINFVLLTRFEIDSILDIRHSKSRKALKKKEK